MKYYDITQIVEKLCGQIYPMAETNYDICCKQNLEDNWFELTIDIITEIERLASVDDNYRQYKSVKEISDSARTFLIGVANDLNEIIKKWEV